MRDLDGTRASRWIDRENGFKEEVGKALQSQGWGGSTIKTLPNIIEGLCKHFMEFWKHSCKEINRRRNEALTRIKHIEEVEDTWNLDVEEASGRRCRGWVAEGDYKLEMDWRQIETIVAMRS